MIKLVVFDLDGTIIDTENIFFNFFKEYNRNNNYESSDEFAYSLLGIRRSELCKKLADHFGEEYPVEHMLMEKNLRMQELLEHGKIAIKPGYFELIKYLKDKKIAKAVASSSSKKRISAYLKSLGIIEDFQFIIGGDNVTQSKPSPEIFLKTAESLAIHPANTMVLEDSVNGIKAAYCAGMLPVMIPDLIKPDAEIKKLLYREAKNFVEVIGIIEENFQ